MDATEYVFEVDVFSPDTIGMSRLAQYMSALATLIGHEERTHFVRLEKGSLRLVHKVDAVDAPKVENRLRLLVDGQAPIEATRAHQRLNELLANDNAVAELSGPVGVIFSGRDTPKPLQYPPVKQKSELTGQIVSIGGRDSTAHLILEDRGSVYTGCELPRAMARDLAQYLYGQTVRLFGTGRWERLDNGTWRLLNFRVDRFEPVDDLPLDEVLRSIAGIDGNGLMASDAYQRLLELRDGEEEVH